MKISTLNDILKLGDKLSPELLESFFEILQFQDLSKIP
jgi:hypothetical protein